MLGFHVIECLLLQTHRLIEHVDFGVEFSQCVVVGGEVRRQHEPGVGQIIGRLLRRGAGPLDFPPNAPE
jgi:hypothetical protein